MRRSAEIYLLGVDCRTVRDRTRRVLYSISAPSHQPRMQQGKCGGGSTAFRSPRSAARTRSALSEHCYTHDLNSMIDEATPIQAS